uniref:Extracellular calcium-sensing receptor-like n=2 Tax=Erpetoichthys calabaricus TaxID=27687 RepID=A0A8C4SBE0_ERPCA
ESLSAILAPRSGFTSFSFRTYRWLHSMVYAINEINGNPNLLPNVTLGYSLYDSCDVIPRGIEGVMWLVSGQDEVVPNYRCNTKAPLAAVIGDGASSVSIPMAILLGIYRYPQISYFATAPALSNKHEFPSFFRTIPTDMVQGIGLAQLVNYFGWSWVGILTDDDDYGQGIAAVFMKEAQASGICVEFLERVPILYSEERTRHIVEVIKASTVNAIAVFSWEAYLYPVIKEIDRQNITGKIWIGSESWSSSPVLSKNQIFKMLTGSIGFAIHRGDIPGFKEYLLSIHPFKSANDIYVKLFWEEAFNCKWTTSIGGLEAENGQKLCNGKEQLAKLDNIFLDVTNLRMTYNTYNAIYAVAHALHDLNSCIPGKGPFKDICVSYTVHWQILHYMKNVHFKTQAGEDIYFDENGDPPALYDIVNWQPTPNGDIQYVKVGSFDSSAPTGKKLILNEDTIIWPGGRKEAPHSVCSISCLPGWRKATRRGQPLCCFDCIACSEGEISNQTDSTECLPCPDDQWPNDRRDTCIPKMVEFLSFDEPLGIVLCIMSMLISLVPKSILGLFIWYRHTPIVKANNRQLSYVLLGALTLCPLCSFIFIGKPSLASCILRQTTFGIIFALSVSCVLAKTVMVIIAFKASKPGSNLRKWVGSRLPNAVACLGTLIQAGICTVWLGYAPPFPQNNMNSQVGKIILECNEGSSLAFWCMMGYMGVLAIISFMMAFLARKLPDSFNEAKFITFSMLVFVSVWLSFIPAYLSTRGKYMVAVEIFAILSSSAGLLACIFFPKCYIILLKPDRNTRDFLMGKGDPANKKN